MSMDTMMDRLAKNVLTKMDLTGTSGLRRLLIESAKNGLGSCILTFSQISDDLAVTATAICRRRFNRDDIVVMSVLDRDEEGEAGIVFTEKGIYHWLENEQFVAEIPYDQIGAVGYQGDSVIITMEDDSNVILYCGEDAVEENYSRYMYNYIVDILMYLQNENVPEA